MTLMRVVFGGLVVGLVSWSTASVVVAADGAASAAPADAAVQPAVVRKAPTVRGPLNQADEQMRARGQAERQQMEARAAARVAARKTPRPGTVEARHPELMAKYDGNQNGRLDWWELEKYRADYAAARVAKGKAKSP